MLDYPLPYKFFTSSTLPSLPSKHTRCRKGRLFIKTHAPYLGNIQDDEQPLFYTYESDAAVVTNATSSRVVTSVDITTLMGIEEEREDEEEEEPEEREEEEEEEREEKEERKEERELEGVK